SGSPCTSAPRGCFRTTLLLEPFGNQIDLARFLARGFRLADGHLVEMRPELLHILIRPGALEHLCRKRCSGLQCLAYRVERQFQKMDGRSLVSGTDAGH